MWVVGRQVPGENGCGCEIPVSTGVVDLEMLRDEEGADRDDHERDEGRDRQASGVHSLITATFGTSKAWNASSPRGSWRHSITRIEPPWQITRAGSSEVS